MSKPEVVTIGLRKCGGLKGMHGSIPEQGRISYMSSVFQSLSDPIRLSIIFALHVTPLCVCVMKSLFKIADSKLSYHLDSLESTGLISAKSEGRFIVYSITELGRTMLSACKRAPVRSW